MARKPQTRSYIFVKITETTVICILCTSSQIDQDPFPRLQFTKQIKNILLYLLGYGCIKVIGTGTF
jgi:hypothetical protein